MVWEKLVADHSSSGVPGYNLGRNLGTIVDVSIDYDVGLIKRTFSINNVTIGGKVPEYTDKEIQECFDRDVYWNKALKSKWIPEVVSIDTKQRTIIQKYYNPCLLDYYPIKDITKTFPQLENQIIEMYKFFKEHNVFKINGALSNLTHKGAQILAIDFKWATKRPEGLENELYSYDNWLCKISDTLPQKLRELI